MQIQACLTTKPLCDTEEASHTLLVDAAFRLELELQLPHTPTSAVRHASVWSVSLHPAALEPSIQTQQGFNFVCFLNTVCAIGVYIGKPLSFLQIWGHFRLL